MIDLTIAVLDTETTGFHPKYGDRIIEISAVKIINGNIIEEDNFSTLINPERPIPAASTRVHNIKNADVADSPLYKDIIPNLKTFLTGVDYLVMHNSKFDIAFLLEENKKAGDLFQLPKTICSVELSKLLNPKLTRHNLNSLSKHFNVFMKEGENRHRALGDVIMTSEILLKFYQSNPLIFNGTLEQISKVV